MGAMVESKAELYTKNQVRWTDEPITVLGVTIARENATNINYAPILAKVKGVFSAWQNRALSLIGKVNIVNTLVASLYIYKMTVLPCMEEGLVKAVENEIEKFLWNGHRPKIPLKTLQLSKECGGLKLVNLRLRDKAMKIKWVNISLEDITVENFVSYFIQSDL